MGRCQGTEADGVHGDVMHYRALLCTIQHALYNICIVSSTIIYLNFKI